MAYAMLALVALLSLMPAPDVGGNDKVMHFITYWLLSAGFTTLARFNRSLLWVSSGLIAYGIVLEYVQGMTGYRFLEGADMLANSAGVLCGLLIRFSPVPVWFRSIESRLFGNQLQY